jgi:hypothetical protein
MSFGPNFSDHRHAAALVDKILRGTEQPSDIPVEQPTKFEFDQFDNC